MNQQLERRGEERRQVVIDESDEILDLTGYTERVEEQIAELMDMNMSANEWDELGPAGHLSNANIPSTEPAVIRNELFTWASSDFIAILLMRGSYHLSKRHYLLIRFILTLADGSQLPSYYRLNEKIRTKIEEHCLPKPMQFEVPLNWRTKFTRPNTKDHILRIVPPSQWAIHDVSFSFTFFRQEVC